MSLATQMVSDMAIFLSVADFARTLHVLARSRARKT